MADLLLTSLGFLGAGGLGYVIARLAHDVIRDLRVLDDPHPPGREALARIHGRMEEGD